MSALSALLRRKSLNSLNPDDSIVSDGRMDSRSTIPKKLNG